MYNRASQLWYNQHVAQIILSPDLKLLETNSSCSLPSANHKCVWWALLQWELMATRRNWVLEVCVFWATGQNLMSSFAGRLPNCVGMVIPKMPAHRLSVDTTVSESRCNNQHWSFILGNDLALVLFSSFSPNYGLFICQCSWTKFYS